jgi:uncharacterized RDD family membrane protein YckC
MSEVVTGDAVVVEVRVAQMPSRGAALIIDLLVQLTLMIGVSLLIGAFAEISDMALWAAVNLLMIVLVTVGYPVISESVTRGRSLGKLAMGLRVVADDGGPERFRQALMRGLAGFMELWLFMGAPALISSLISQRGKRLGDIFAGTIVISERGPRGHAQPVGMPPQLERWAAGLELSQLPDEVADAARQYITRWHDLAPHVQHEMGGRIAAQVAAYVSPAAPYGVPPQAYVSAVLAERRRRELVRLTRRQYTPSGYGRIPTPGYGYTRRQENLPEPPPTVPGGLRPPT